MTNYTEIGRATINVGSAVNRLNAPIGTQLAFIEAEGAVRYSISDTAEALTKEGGGALLSAGTKIDIKGIAVYHFRMISAEDAASPVHITFFGS